MKMKPRNVWNISTHLVTSPTYLSACLFDQTIQLRGYFPAFDYSWEYFQSTQVTFYWELTWLSQEPVCVGSVQILAQSVRRWCNWVATASANSLPGKGRSFCCVISSRPAFSKSKTRRRHLATRYIDIITTRDNDQQSYKHATYMDRVPDTLIIVQLVKKHHALYEIRKLQLCYKSPELVSVLSQLYPLLTFADHLCSITVI